MVKNYFLILFLLVLTCCNQKQVDWHGAQQYYPSQELLLDGVVNKYYEYHRFFDGRDPLIRIFYKAYFLGEEGTLVEKYFDPSYTVFLARTFRIDSGRQQLNEEIRYTPYDTIKAEILSDGYINWVADKEVLILKSIYSSGEFNLESIQLSNTDTIFENRAAKAFEFQRHSTFNGEDSWDVEKSVIYSEGLGLTYEISHETESEVRLELVEQMPFSEFEKMSKNVSKRVGYIAPEERLDEEEFELCFGGKRLNDYYNSEPDGRYAKNKNGLVNDIKAQLNTSKLKNESGFLTFRFIVNCEGNAGYFTAEENDLEYQPKAFDIETKDHLFEILRSLNNWRPVIINDESRDAHYYVTFKLKDGEITDILP